jgi:hypothetical protein
MIPPDIPAGEHEALLEVWFKLGGRRWRRGEKWRYSDACEWEGVKVRGGERLERIPEVKLVKWPTETNAISKDSLRDIVSDSTTASQAKSRRGEPLFKEGEQVFVRSRLPNDGGLAGWQLGDALRPARIDNSAMRGKGVHQVVEYDVR